MVGWERTIVQLRWNGGRVGKDNGTTKVEWWYGGKEQLYK